MMDTLAGFVLDKEGVGYGGGGGGGGLEVYIILSVY